MREAYFAASPTHAVPHHPVRILRGIHACKEPADMQSVFFTFAALLPVAHVAYAEELGENVSRLRWLPYGIFPIAFS